MKKGLSCSSLRLVKFALILAAAISSTFISSYNVFAANSFTGGLFRYTIDSNPSATANISSIPSELLTGAFGYSKRLNGVLVNVSMSGSFSGNYLTNYAAITVRLDSASGAHVSFFDNVDMVITGVSNKGTSLTGSCATSRLDSSSYLEVVCNISASNYEYPETAAITIGRTSSDSQTVAFSCGGVSCMSSPPIGSVWLRSVTFDLDSSTDPNTGILNDQLNEQRQTNDLLEQQSQQDQQDRDDMGQASDDANSSADDSAQAVSDASDSLLVIMGNFIDIVLHPPSTNCKIDADMGHMDLGEIDLCQLPVPPAVGTIATVLLIGLLIPFVVSLINTFLSLLKGATQ